MCGGASQQQKDMGAQQQATAQTLNQAFQSRFAGQDAILNKLNTAYTSAITAGSGQPGFDTATRRALEARALDTTAANYGNAARAVGGQLAGRGGDTGILSGVDAQIKGAIATQQAQQLSGEQRDIAIQDAMLGNQKYNTALAGLSDLSRQYDPTQYSSQAMTGQKQAYDTQKSIDSQKGGFWKTLGGIVKTVAPMALGAFTGGASLGVSKGLFGAVTGAAGAAGSGVASGINTLMGTNPGEEPVDTESMFPSYLRNSQ